ncbi:MAG: hypothetical protein K2O84_11500, partial [Oscillospiraceae bacterium]|nr:hypothetical protein [Oscillospiraceae bacterium]
MVTANVIRHKINASYGAPPILSRIQRNPVVFKRLFSVLPSPAKDFEVVSVPHDVHFFESAPPERP